jgi:hypothetical protein
MLMELRYTELEERYRTRLLYALTPPEQEQRAAELADAQNLRVEWQQLTAAAEELDAGLYAVKAKFRDTTRQQVRGPPACKGFLQLMPNQGSRSPCNVLLRMKHKPDLAGGILTCTWCCLCVWYRLCPSWRTPRPWQSVWQHLGLAYLASPCRMASWRSRPSQQRWRSW